MSYDDMWYVSWNKYRDLYDKEGFNLARDAADRRSTKGHHAPSNCQCMTCQSREITRSIRFDYPRPHTPDNCEKCLNKRVRLLQVDVDHYASQMKLYKKFNRLWRYISWSCTAICIAMLVTGSWITAAILAANVGLQQFNAKACRKRYYGAANKWVTASEDLANAKLELELKKNV